MIKRLYRVYKKTKDHYRVELRQASGWTEIETNKQIGKLVLQNCYFVVHAGGRAATVRRRFAASTDMPVHAWIECSGYSFEKIPFTPVGILYHNPFTVRCFMDRASYEAGTPRVLFGADQVRIDGNFLEYAGGRSAQVDPKTALVPDSVVAYDESLIYSPLARETRAIAEAEDEADRLIYSPLPADHGRWAARKIIGP